MDDSGEIPGEGAAGEHVRVSPSANEYRELSLPVQSAIDTRVQLLSHCCESACEREGLVTGRE